MVCIPAHFWKKLHADALKDLQALDYGTDIFLSEADIILAWWTRVAISHIPEDSSRTVTIQNLASLRRALQHDLLPEDKPYVSNAFGYVNIVLPAK